MSASRERKKRVELGQNVTEIQQPAKKKKISEGMIFAIVILLVVAAFIGFVIGRDIWMRNQTVLTVGEHKVAVKEFNYFYNSLANQYLTYASYFGSSYGVSGSTPLDEEVITSSHVNFLNMMSLYGYMSLDTSYLKNFTADDSGSYGVTMAQLLADCAKTQIVSCYVTFDDAVANGYELDAECYDEIDVEIEEMKTQGKETYGWSLNKTIRNTFGDGCNKQGYYDYMVLTHTASHYTETLSYTDAEIEARYNEGKEEFDVASFYYYTVSASDFVEADEEGNKAEPTEAEEEKAKVAAESMEKNFVMDDEEKNVTLVNDYTYDSVKSFCGEDAAKWIFDETTAADAVKCFENNDSYYVLKFVDNKDYSLVNVLQIYVPADSEEETAEGEESVEAAEPAEATESAATKVAAIEAALQSDASAENFKALAEQYSNEGTEVEVNELTRSSLSGVSEEACVWTMSKDRAVGDYAKFEVNGGTIFLMVTGYGETFIHAAVNQTLASEWLEAAVEAAVAVCGYDEKAAMHGNVGLAMNAAG